MNPSVVAIIPARGGSKGLPRKNVLPIGGRPLIAWSIAAATASTRVRRTVVSTDDAEIAATATASGAEVPFLRPSEIAQDDSTQVQVVEHVLSWLSAEGPVPDYVLLLQPTSPLRTTGDIDAAIDLAVSRGCDVLVSVAPAHPHPWLSKRILSDGTIRPFTEVSTDLRRQDLPDPYVLNGAIYLITPEALRRHQTFSPDGAVAYVMPSERSIDIDTEYELQLADFMLRRAAHADV